MASLIQRSGGGVVILMVLVVFDVFVFTACASFRSQGQFGDSILEEASRQGLGVCTV